MNAQTSAVERSPGALTNESVLKFVKAGMGDDVVTSMITSESGKFSPATDDLIALKQAGVSDRILSA